MSSSRRRTTQSGSRSRSNDKRPRLSSAQLSELVSTLLESVDELKTDVLVLTRKVVSLEAELDHVQGRRSV